MAVGGMLAGDGHAQDMAAEDGTGSLLMDEILVTAQKREQDIQQVGIAITAFSGEQMRRLGVEESTELALMVPGVHLSGSSGGQFVNFTIRGVAQNEFSDFAESPNAVYIDETYIAQLNNQRFGSFDLERVEVLKGPQ
ncbi:MAG: Plug domain-containing protein, partial [Sphingomonadales bacterium]|nr:Plug domain-containing protein [Sphingomonadales bacterium]